MTILSAQTIRRLGIMTPCHERTRHPSSGLTYGLSGAGYDLTLKDAMHLASHRDAWYEGQKSFRLGVAQEHFSLPNNVLGRVCDKSSLARRGIQVFNTVIEPGWRGYLTLEIVNHGDTITLEAGQPIAQVIFELLDEPTEQPYAGRYQDQPLRPVEAMRLTGREETI